MKNAKRLRHGLNAAQLPTRAFLLSNCAKTSNERAMRALARSSRGGGGRVFLTACR